MIMILLTHIAILFGLALAICCEQDAPKYSRPRWPDVTCQRAQNGMGSLFSVAQIIISNPYCSNMQYTGSQLM